MINFDSYYIPDEPPYHECDDDACTCAEQAQENDIDWLSEDIPEPPDMFPEKCPNPGCSVMNLCADCESTMVDFR